MKKTLATPIVLLALFVNNISIFGQAISADPEIINELINRTLIVEQLEPDEEIVASFDKRIAKAKKQVLVDKYAAEKEEYLLFAEQYNELISRAASEVLKSHESIEYKTSSEVKKLREDGSTDYTVLYYSPYTIAISNLHIKSLKYSRIENKKTDYSFFLPAIAHRDEAEIMKYGDYKIALKLMVNHLEGIRTTQKKNYPFINYAKDQAKLNCEEKAGNVLTIDQQMIQKNQSEEAMSKAFGNSVNLGPTSALMDLIENDTDQLVALAIPLSIVTGTSPSGSALNVSTSKINVIKCLVNAKTGKILASTGQKAFAYFNAKDLKKMSSCQ
ncbi:MAG: hypothetical protein ABJF11_12765 [Reichenbachiella sp.]|uniref:hypothetical protein n=1 Tax=Reichenbachiella sp. TaxID=2184521 RepID=UPI003265499F